MREMRRPARWISSALLTSGVACLVACEERLTPTTPTPHQPQATTVLEGGGSVAGKAIDNAHNLQDQVKAHNDEVAKQAEELSNPK
jgi:hypothetical protein